MVVEHVIRRRTVKSQIWFHHGRPVDAWQWVCSCGAVGPERLHEHSARRGGKQHVSRSERRPDRARLTALAGP